MHSMQQPGGPGRLIVTADQVTELRAIGPAVDAWLIFDGTHARVTESTYALAEVVEIANRNTLIDLTTARTQNKDPVDDRRLAADLTEIAADQLAQRPRSRGLLPTLEKLARQLAAQAIVRCGPPIAMTTTGGHTALLQAYGPLGHDHTITRRHAHTLFTDRDSAPMTVDDGTGKRLVPSDTPLWWIAETITTGLGAAPDD